MTEELIDPSTIKIEPETKYIHSERTGYIPPTEKRPFHKIESSGFGPKSSNIMVIEEAWQKFREVKTAPNYIEEFSQEEWSAILKNIENIKQKLESDIEYREAMEGLLVSHEESHRLHQVRFDLSKNYDRAKPLKNAFDYDNEGNQMFGDYEQNNSKLQVYGEAEATISGLRKSDCNIEVKSDFLFLRACHSFSNEMFPDNGPKSFDSKLRKNFTGIQLGFGGMVSEHSIPDLIIASGDFEMLEKIQSGKIKVDDFRQFAVSSMKSMLLDPEKVVRENIENENFNKGVDIKLMESVQLEKDLLNRMEARNIEINVEDEE